MARPALFLDRDGTINEDRHYLSDPAGLELIPGAAAAIAEVNRLGVPIIVVTNQAGIAKGLIPPEAIPLIHIALSAELARYGAHVDAYYYCPHHPGGEHPDFTRECDCRKPRPGMLQQAAQEHDLDLNRSWMIGDRLSDAEAGAAAGCRTVLVRTGYGSQLPDDLDATALNLAARVDDLVAAIAFWRGSLENR